VPFLGAGHPVYKRACILLTVTNEVSGGLGEVCEGADIGGREVVDEVRIVCDGAQLSVVDQLADTDHDEVYVGALGQERLADRLQTVVGRAVRDENHHVAHVQTVAGRQRKHLRHRPRHRSVTPQRKCSAKRSHRVGVGIVVSIGLGLGLAIWLELYAGLHRYDSYQSLDDDAFWLGR